MQFVRQHRFTLLFMATLVFCSIMIIRQLHARENKHVEIREAFILLHTTGYTNEAMKLYNRLLMDYPQLSNKELLDDFQRTLLLVDPSANQPSNLVWKYHWTISKELERRSESSLVRALEIAAETK
jgi:hypothetical protein